MGAKRIRELFGAARKCKRGCIIFIDEIDAIGNREHAFRNNQETTTTINQFLSEMDGFIGTEKVVVVAATNRVDMVDPAILRSGRFDVKIEIGLPSEEERKGILKTLLNKKLKNRHDITEEMISFIGEESKNWCGADLETLINEAIFRAIADGKQRMNDQHMSETYFELTSNK